MEDVEPTRVPTSGVSILDAFPRDVYRILAYLPRNSQLKVASTRLIDYVESTVYRASNALASCWKIAIEGSAYNEPTELFRSRVRTASKSLKDGKHFVDRV